MESNVSTEGGPDDRDAGNAARVRHAKRDILERAGGTYATNEVAELLGVGADEVRRRLREGRLLAYEGSSGEYRFPRGQFTETGVLPGLEDVLAAMNIDAAWMRIQFSWTTMSSAHPEQGVSRTQLSRFQAICPNTKTWADDSYIVVVA